ncbi:DNA ligase, partial [Candidatus Woesearchaeota archaeon]|nr:DNA ligase [Candidatus Woesearchaeota archaeon]
MRFEILADVFEQIERASSGNQMREILAKFFRKCPKDEINKTTYLLLGSIAPKSESVVLGMAEKMVLKSIALDSGKSPEYIKKLFRKKGDVGLTAEYLTTKEKGKLNILHVFDELHKIAKASGSGSSERKIRILAGLLKKASPKEARYIARIVLGTLRLGASEMTILDALSIAFTGTKKNKGILEDAYNTNPDIGLIANTIAKKGIRGISGIGNGIGKPIQMMLCQRVQNIADVRKKMKWPVSVEEKYDGERIQAHYSNKKIVLYSRRLENVTHQFPDIADAIKKQIKARQFIIEGEVVAVDSSGKLLPFQVLMQRRRKYHVEEY